ncbi:Ncstrn_small domain-containing protein [Meloidogyne graminicola]|uniref:ribonuclease H n=1 Tax=Meloidogyne graminicola TaxID=189291 RepID=A0A8S9ZCP4_9BILA|nr:Ncstrn_small domain-containing protein [Meloidogyne graminicola]
MMKNGIPVVYTDGACSRNGSSNPKAGIGVFWGDNHNWNVSAPVTGRATNNVAEYSAIICGIEKAISEGLTKLIIRTDSQLIINSCSIPYNKQIKDESLRCIGRMVLFMFAAGNSKLCLERQEKSSGLGEQVMLCDNLEDNNIFALLPPLSQKQKDLKPNIFVLAARINNLIKLIDSSVNFINPLNITYGSVPPSSYHSLLKNDKNIPGLILSSFGEGKYNFK